MSQNWEPPDEPWVLIVDDEAPVRRFLGRMMRRWGYPHLFARDGKEALTLIDPKDPPAVVILDIMLPGIDGWEVARRLLLSMGDGAPPIIMLSALFGDEQPPDPDRAIVAVLPKPFSVERLREILVSVLERAK